MDSRNLSEKKVTTDCNLSENCCFSKNEILAKKSNQYNIVSVQLKKPQSTWIATLTAHFF